MTSLQVLFKKSKAAKPMFNSEEKQNAFRENWMRKMRILTSLPPHGFLHLSLC
jgi:hypothetical protein